jgi:hypothetical protein
VATAAGCRPAGRRLQRLHQRHGTLPVVALVAQFDARRLAPEDVGRQHHEAVERVLLGHGADVLVDAEDLLEQHQPGPLPAGGSAR